MQTGLREGEAAARQEVIAMGREEEQGDSMVVPDRVVDHQYQVSSIKPYFHRSVNGCVLREVYLDNLCSVSNFYPASRNAQLFTDLWKQKEQNTTNKRANRHVQCKDLALVYYSETSKNGKGKLAEDLIFHSHTLLLRRISNYFSFD